MVKTALVTGAANGIGRAISLRLAKDGMAVGVLDIDLAGAERVASEIKAAGGQAIALEASIADRPAVQAAVDKLRGAFGPITVLVNNAGIPGFCRFQELTDEVWDRTFEINVKGTFIVTQVVLPDMEAAKWGRIVNISSSSAQTGAVTMAHYSASKGAVITLTRTLAQELGPLGITVNNIPPGSVLNTVMSNANLERFPIPMDVFVNSIPVRRAGEPEDIAGATSFLCSEEAGYISGQTFGVNGGRITT